MGKGRKVKDNHLSINMYTQDNGIAHYYMLKSKKFENITYWQKLLW